MVTLCILDGFGINKNTLGNAITAAGTPFLDKLTAEFPHTKILASGEAVGLPEGQMGNSEVGHLTIGGGRIIEQDLLHIDNEIKRGDFFNNSSLIKAFEFAQNNNSNLHILGLLSDGGIHSKISHLFAILDASKKYNIKNIYIHAITDGRDTAVTSGKGFVKCLYEKINGTNAKLATIIGRVYAMDRENRYDRIEKAYNLFVYGNGEEFDNGEKALQASYNKNITDEFIEPIILDKNGVIRENDSIIFFNYRSDRAREITYSLTDKNFDKFKVTIFKNILFTPMQEYSKDLSHLNTIYPPKIIKDNLSAIISQNKLKQFHISETTKYAHVTFFFNGGIELAYDGEDRKLIDSYNDKNFATHPKMRAEEITTELISAINSKKYDFLLVNLSNPDMIGHTGDFEASKITVSCCDECAYKIALETLKNGGDCIITADHGNIEEMFDENGNILTKHTTNPVPFILVSNKYKNSKLSESGSLANIAPTILDLLNISIPNTMEQSLLTNNKLEVNSEK